MEERESWAGCLVFWWVLGISPAAGACHAFLYFQAPLRNPGLAASTNNLKEFSRMIQYFPLLRQGSAPLALLTALEALSVDWFLGHCIIVYFGKIIKKGFRLVFLGVWCGVGGSLSKIIQ